MYWMTSVSRKVLCEPGGRARHCWQRHVGGEDSPVSQRQARALSLILENSDADPDPNPDPSDPLVRGMDPDPDPSVTKYK